MTEFQSLEEIEDHIKVLSKKYLKGKPFEEEVIDIFASKLIDDHESFARIQSCFYVETANFMPHIVLNNLDKLKDIDLSFYKICVLCGLRGPLTQKDLDKQVKKNKNSTIILILAKHKDFPLHLKEMFYQLTEDVEYLPKEAQTLFVF